MKRSKNLSPFVIWQKKFLVKKKNEISNTNSIFFFFILTCFFGFSILKNKDRRNHTKIRISSKKSKG